MRTLFAFPWLSKGSSFDVALLRGLSLLRPWSTAAVRGQAFARPQDVMDIAITRGPQPLCIVELKDGRRRVVARGARAVEVGGRLMSLINALEAPQGNRPSALRHRRKPNARPPR